MSGELHLLLDLPSLFEVVHVASWLPPGIGACGKAWEGQGHPDLASGLCWSCWWSDQVLAMGGVVCAGYMDLTTLNFSDVRFIHTGLCPTSVKVFILLVICLFKDLCELRVKYQPDSEPLNSFFPEFL